MLVAIFVLFVTELAAISDYTALCERIDTGPPDVPFSGYQVKDALYVNHFACAYLRMLTVANLHDMVQITLSVHFVGQLANSPGVSKVMEKL